MTREELRPASPETPPVEQADGQFLLVSSEEELVKELARVPEIGIQVQANRILRTQIDRMAVRARTSVDVGLTDPSAITLVRPDLRGLPFRRGPGCQLTAREAAELQTLSRKLRIYLNRALPPGPDGRRPAPTLLREVLRQEMRGKRPEWLRPASVPTLLQMLMHEGPPLRQMLVDLLAEVPGPEATVALAQRAVFDLSAEVRRSAAEALRGRSAECYRPVFLQALRYPWAPPADHAAAALICLGEKEAVPDLVRLLDQPDPSLPVILGKRYSAVREVVRVNHAQNCLLCHPPALTGSDPVVGLDPVLRIPVTQLTSSPQGQRQLQQSAQRVATTPGGYNYGGSGGQSVTATTSLIPLMIRGDVTYVRQDFSVTLPLPRPVVQPGGVVRRGLRFDYMVRSRLIPTKSAKQLLELTQGQESYPQREAVLRALRTLTGEDPGDSAEEWFALYPRAKQDAEAERLAGQLLRAREPDWDDKLAELRDGKGVVHTVALGLAIPRLRMPFRARARQALAERLTRMTVATLRDKLRAENAEVRRAAVAACLRQDQKELVPELIALLEDPRQLTARAAEAALRELTEQDHASPAAWRDWWREQ